MPYTETQIVELAAVKVQEVVMEKVQAFTDGVEKEVHKLRLEMKDSNQFNSAIQKGLNSMTTELAILEPMKKQVTELYALFCKNGYMQRFNMMAARLEEFFRTRFETCPVAQDMREIKRRMDAQSDEAVKRAEGKLRTREQDVRDRTRWRTTALLSLAGVAVAGLTLLTKLLRWW